MPPPLPKQPLGFRVGAAAAANQMDCFIDLACPFSKKIFKQLLEVHAWSESVKSDVFAVRFLVMPQPWHPQSPVLAEAVLAVHKLAPSQTVAFTDKLFDAAEDQFYDHVAFAKSRVQMHVELGDIVAAAYPTISRESFAALLACKSAEGGSKNSGNDVTQELKWHVKYHRACGVHVTPTCFMNNIEAVEISSGWTLAQWQEFLTPFM
jgi:protein-disulfide isomerase